MSIRDDSMNRADLTPAERIAALFRDFLRIAASAGILLLAIAAVLGGLVLLGAIRRPGAWA